MSLYFTLEFATELRIERIAALLEREAGFVLIEAGDLKARAVTACLGAQDQVNKQIVYEDFGLSTDLHLIMFPHQSDGINEGNRHVARAVAAVLRRTQGDAGLFYNGEEVILQRLNERTTIKDGWVELLSPALEDVGVAHKRRDSLTPAA